MQWIVRCAEYVNVTVPVELDASDARRDDVVDAAESTGGGHGSSGTGNRTSSDSSSAAGACFVNGMHIRSCNELDTVSLCSMAGKTYGFKTQKNQFLVLKVFFYLFTVFFKVLTYTCRTRNKDPQATSTMKSIKTCSVSKDLSQAELTFIHN